MRNRGIHHCFPFNIVDLKAPRLAQMRARAAIHLWRAVRGPGIQYAKNTLLLAGVDGRSMIGRMYGSNFRMNCLRQLSSGPNANSGRKQGADDLTQEEDHNYELLRSYMLSPIQFEFLRALVLPAYNQTIANKAAHFRDNMNDYSYFHRAFLLASMLTLSQIHCRLIISCGAC
jgi:hypothetical protein